MSWVRDLHLQKDDFTLSISEWEILDQGVTAVIGPSGAGKSTLFRVLLGLEECQFSWKWKDLDLALLKAPERKMGVVFQTLDLFPHMTARENILFAAEARGLNKMESQQQLNHLRDALDMASFLNRRASDLSGGERQRVALSRAIIGKPRILLLDEPFSALDSSLRQDARILVRDFLKSEQIPALIVTHDEEDVKVLGHKLTRLETGRIVADQLI